MPDAGGRTINVNEGAGVTDSRRVSHDGGLPGRYVRAAGVAVRYQATFPVEGWARCPVFFRRFAVADTAGVRAGVTGWTVSRVNGRACAGARRRPRRGEACHGVPGGRRKLVLNARLRMDPCTFNWPTFWPLP
jgi:hypothetical protein